MPHLGLYTILLLRILYGVWHIRRRSRWGRRVPNSRAIVLQQCGQCRQAGRMKGRLTSAQTTRSKTISCNGQASPIVARGLPARARSWYPRIARPAPPQRCLTLRYSLVLSVWVDPPAEHRCPIDYRIVPGRFPNPVV